MGKLSLFGEVLELKMGFVLKSKFEQAVTAGEIEFFGDLEAVIIDGLLTEE